MIKLKRQLYREIRQSEDPNLKRTFNSLTNSIQKMVFQYKTSKWLETCQEINESEGRNYWEKIKKLSKYETLNKIELIQENNQMFTRDEEIAQAFKSYYESVFERKDNPLFCNINATQIDRWYQEHFSEHLNPEIILIDENEFYSVLYQSKNTAPGQDGIPRQIIQKLTPEIHTYIIKIMNFCLVEGYFPDEWKKGIIINIPKPNQDHTKTCNYKPITLLPVMVKMFEKIIKNRLNEQLGHKLPIYQFGFRSGTSTKHALAVLTANAQTVVRV